VVVGLLLLLRSHSRFCLISFNNNSSSSSSNPLRFIPR
jgi:hypothetical protein